MIARIIFCVFLCVGANALAHETDSAGQFPAYDCDHPPEAAVKALPGLLGEAGRLVCMREGQRIVASKAWSWRYSGSFFNTPNVPAYAHASTQGMMPPFYFRKVSAKTLEGAEAQKRSDEISAQLVTYRPEKEIAGMTIVTAENNYGHITEIFMPMQSDTEGWAIVCTPQCEPEYVILISKLQPN